MPWQKGQSGNPGGKTPKSKKLLSDKFVRALMRDFEEKVEGSLRNNGEKVIEAVRKDDPTNYLRLIASLVPKEMLLEIAVPDSRDDSEILAEVEEQIRALKAQGVEVPTTETLQ